MPCVIFLPCFLSCFMYLRSFSISYPTMITQLYSSSFWIALVLDHFGGSPPAPLFGAFTWMRSVDFIYLGILVCAFLEFVATLRINFLEHVSIEFLPGSSICYCSSLTNKLLLWKLCSMKDCLCLSTCSCSFYSYVRLLLHSTLDLSWCLRPNLM